MGLPAAVCVHLGVCVVWTTLIGLQIYRRGLLVEQRERERVQEREKERGFQTLTSH